MALSQNEDFTIWYLRTAYLNKVKDGVAERLINVNSSVLNTPGFRAAGWSADGVHRTHSPPIPTTVHSQYFQPGIGLLRQESHGDEDEDEGGMVTGRRSNDTVGPGLNVKRRRKREQIDDDDSSDLSDESDEDDEPRAAQQIKFAKMPARERADSSPIRHRDGKVQPEPSLAPTPKLDMQGRRRGSSLGTVEAVKARARANTATSSDMSSENEVDAGYFQRRQLQARKPTKTRFMTDAMIYENEESGAPLTTVSTQDDFDAGSIDSDLSSDLGETAESGSLMHISQLPTSSPVLLGLHGSETRPMRADSPKRPKFPPLDIDLPPPRPISFVQPVSLLSNALNAQKTTPTNPVEKFATLSGKGSPSPLWIRIYVPSSKSPGKPFEMPLSKASKEGAPVIVAEAIGLALWRYCEDGLQPSLMPVQLNVNRWSLRMVEDGEVDFDFPALQRTKPITDFTSNNNRGARARSREKPFDEFALVEASEREFEANMQETPAFAAAHTEPDKAKEDLTASQKAMRLGPPPLRIVPASPRPNLLVAGQPFGSALTDKSVTPADRPAPIAAQSTPRLGIMKTVRIRYFEPDVSAQSMTMEVSTDSYIAEILDHICKRWNLDKGSFVLKIAGSNNVAPLDRTVEILGPRSDLELVRKRFVGGPAASPGSSSPVTPLFLDIEGPKKVKKGQQHPLAQKQDLMTSAMNFKKFYVTRKQLTSFTQSSSRVLIFDGDLLHNMPADTGKTFDAHAKTNSFPFMDITKCKVSTKHSKLIRIFIQRGAESKRYDFEARTSTEARAIADEINKEMRRAQP